MSNILDLVLERDEIDEVEILETLFKPLEISMIATILRMD